MIKPGDLVKWTGSCLQPENHVGVCVSAEDTRMGPYRLVHVIFSVNGVGKLHFYSSRYLEVVSSS